jgi:hypothetical protein
MLKKYSLFLYFLAFISFSFATLIASDSEDEDRLIRGVRSVHLNSAADEQEGSFLENERIRLPLTVMASPTRHDRTGPLKFPGTISISFLGHWGTFEERNPGKTREEGYQYMIDKLSNEISETFWKYNRERHFDGFSINYSNLDERLLDDLGRILSTCLIQNPKINFHECKFMAKGLLGRLKKQYPDHLKKKPTMQKCVQIRKNGWEEPITDR